MSTGVKAGWYKLIITFHILFHQSAFFKLLITDLFLFQYFSLYYSLNYLKNYLHEEKRMCVTCELMKYPIQVIAFNWGQVIRHVSLLEGEIATFKFKEHVEDGLHVSMCSGTPIGSSSSRLVDDD
jgi:hypothetical protein